MQSFKVALAHKINFNKKGLGMSNSTFVNTVSRFVLDGYDHSPRSNGKSRAKSVEDSLYDMGKDALTDFVTSEYGDTAGKVVGQGLDYATGSSPKKSGMSAKGRAYQAQREASIKKHLSTLPAIYGRLQSPNHLENQWGVLDADVGWSSTRRGYIHPTEPDELRATNPTRISDEQLANEIGASSSNETALKDKLNQLFFRELRDQSNKGIPTLIDAVKFFINKYPYVGGVRIRVDKNAPRWRDLNMQKTVIRVLEKSVRALRANTMKFLASDSYPSRFTKDRDYNAYLRNKKDEIVAFVFQVVPQFHTHAIPAAQLEAVARAVGKKFGIDVHVGNHNAQVRYLVDRDKVWFASEPMSDYAAITSAGEVSDQADMDRVVQTEKKHYNRGGGYRRVTKDPSRSTTLPGNNESGNEGSELTGDNEGSELTGDNYEPGNEDDGSSEVTDDPAETKKPFFKTGAGIATILVSAAAVAGGIVYFATKE